MMQEQNQEPTRAESTTTAGKEVESETWASPIEIDTSQGNEVDLGALNVVWNRYATSHLVNTGSRISIRLPGHAFLEAPFLRENYEFVDLTFHYNEDNNNGNEHIIDGKRYAMEGHFLFAHTYTIDITRNLLEAYKIYDDYKTGRTPVPDVEDSDSVLGSQLTRRTSPSPSAVTFFVGEPAPASTTSFGGEEKPELTPLEKQKKKLDSIEQEVFIERWNKERSSRAAVNRKPTACPKQLLTTPALPGKFNDDEIKAEGAKSALDRRLVKKYETTAKRKAEKQAHDLASVEYPAWRRQKESPSGVNEEENAPQFGASELTVESSGTGSAGRIALSKLNPIKETKSTKAELKKIQFKTVSIYCCVAVQFELDDTAPKYNLFSYLPSVQEPFTEVLIDGNVLFEFDEALKSTEFSVYHGSLTVSPYSIGVQWVLMDNPMKISGKQIDALRSLKDSEGNSMKSHFRGIQARDNRKIWKNKPRKIGVVPS